MTDEPARCSCPTVRVGLTEAARLGDHGDCPVHNPPSTALTIVPDHNPATILLVEGQPPRPVNDRTELARAFAEAAGDVMRSHGLEPTEASAELQPDGSTVLRFKGSRPRRAP